jgi:hypothetical protein
VDMAIAHCARRKHRLTASDAQHAQFRHHLHAFLKIVGLTQPVCCSSSLLVAQLSLLILIPLD